MKNFRSIVILVLLALVLAAVPAAFAQDGTFGLSEGDIALMTAANENLAATSATFEFTVSVVGTGLGENGADVTADITGTGAFDTTDPKNPLVQLDVTGTADGEPINLNLRVVDGNVYTNEGDGWKVEPADEVVSDVTGELGDVTGDVDPSSLSPSSAMSMAAGFEKYITVTRSDDGNLAKFTFALDIPGLLSSPEIGELVMGASGMGGSDTSDAQMAQMTQMLAMMFADATLTIAEHIDTATETVSGAAVNINFPLAAITGVDGAGLVVAIDASLSNYGEPVTVEVPEGAVAAADS